MKVFDELAGRDAITAEDAFTLVATYGFPIELAQELAEERGQAVDIDGFRELMEGHREVSRARRRGLDAAGRRAARRRRATGRPSSSGTRRPTCSPTVIDAAPAGGRGSSCKLEQSPFYAAGGGQVSDQGYLVVDGETERLDGRRRAQVRRRPGARRRARRAFAADAGTRVRSGRQLGRALPDAGEPHRDAPAAPGAARRARRPREAGGLGGAARQAALRLHARAAADAGGARRASSASSTTRCSRRSRCARS